MSPLLHQENRSRGQPSSPRGSPGPEAELAGSGTYMRFDVPRPKIKRSWPSFRGVWWAQGRGWGEAILQHFVGQRERLVTWGFEEGSFPSQHT